MARYLMKYILGAITVDTRYDLPAHRHTHTHMIWYDIQVILIVGTEIDRYLGLAKQKTMFYVGRD